MCRPRVRVLPHAESVSSSCKLSQLKKEGRTSPQVTDCHDSVGHPREPRTIRSGDVKSRISDLLGDAL
jgi:hypothetical protein